MAFHHDEHGRARFGAKAPGGHNKPQPGARPVSGDKTKKLPGEAENPEAAQGTRAGEEHIEHTHPGMTKPHPVTGVHAFHAHHVGDGKYVSHTHHGHQHPDGMHVHTQNHESHDEMMAAHHEAFPPQEEADEEHEGAADGTEFADVLGGGVGGQSEHA